MKVDHPPFFVSPKLSASSFAMPSRPMKRSRSRSRSRDGQVDRPLVSTLVFDEFGGRSSLTHPAPQKRVTLAPVKGADVFPQRPLFHTILPVIDFSQQKSPAIPTGGYSMTPLWGPRPQSNTTTQPPSHENQVDDGDVVSLMSA